MLLLAAGHIKFVSNIQLYLCCAQTWNLPNLKIGQAKLGILSLGANLKIGQAKLGISHVCPILRLGSAILRLACPNLEFLVD